VAVMIDEHCGVPPLPVTFDGERAGVRGSSRARRKLLPLTLTLSP
jgi:hypothetical protein